MLTLSDTNLHCILRCLNWKSNPDGLDSLRRSCKRINAHACAVGMNKAENVVLNLTSTCSIDRELYRPEKRYSVITEIGYQRDCDDNCSDCPRPQVIHRRLPMDAPQPLPLLPRIQIAEIQRQLGLGHIPSTEIYEYVFPDDMLLRESNSMQLNELNVCRHGIVTYIVARKNEVLEQIPSNEYFMERLNGAFIRVRSVSTLRLSGWRIDETLFRYLISHPKIKTVRAIHFLHCVMTMKMNEFLEFLQSRQIEEVHLHSRFRGFSIDDSCLMNANRIHLTGTNELQYGDYPGITDNLLKRWMQKTPININFVVVKTKFTISELIGLLKASVANNSNAVYHLGSSAILAEELSIFFRTTRETRNLNWEIMYHQDECLDISCRIESNDKFYFQISLSLIGSEAGSAKDNYHTGGSDRKKIKEDKNANQQDENYVKNDK